MEGNVSFAKGFMVLIGMVIALTAAVANTDNNKNVNHWGGGGGGGAWGGGSKPKKIVVGGAVQWQFGNNYAAWACSSIPFYQFDTLVFKYPRPNISAGIFPHSVFLLPDYQSYLNCDLSRAVRVADPTQGGGNGFEFMLKPAVPHYFACGERNGFHCINGTMKFIAFPWPRYWQ